MRNDYFGLSQIVSLILALIPFTSWICGLITRYQDGDMKAFVIRLLVSFTGIGALIIYIADLVCMITRQEIWRPL